MATRVVDSSAHDRTFDFELLYLHAIACTYPGGGTVLAAHENFAGG